VEARGSIQPYGAVTTSPSWRKHTSRGHKWSSHYGSQFQQEWVRRTNMDTESPEVQE